MKSWIRNLWSQKSQPKRQFRSARPELEGLESREVPTVTFHGGAVLPNVEVQGLYYGSDWSTSAAYSAQRSQLDGFLKYIVQSGYTSAMLNMPQMYENMTLPDIYRGDIQQIKDNGHYLIGLINDILDLSKIEAGKLELLRESISLAEIFRGVLATSVGLVKDKAVLIKSDFSDQLPRVWADPTRVRQIVLNLMSNAVKFTDRGSVTLRARLENTVVRISVIDTGIGIREKALPHILTDSSKQTLIPADFTAEPGLASTSANSFARCTAAI